ARRHRDPSRSIGRRTGGNALPASARPRRTARHAPARRPLPPRPRHALPTHRPARAGTGAPHHGDAHVPRDGDYVLAGEGGERSHEATEIDWPAKPSVIDPPRPPRYRRRT